MRRRDPVRGGLTDYIASIDGLRAVAVLSVIAFHFNKNILPGGFIGVDIFFVISGYVISKSLSASSNLPFFHYLADFYKRRFLRIGPALIVCLSLTAIISSIFTKPSWLSASNNATGLAAFVGLSNVFLLIRSDGYFEERIAFNPYAHTWSLGVEEQFYIIFPVLFFFWLKILDVRKSSLLRKLFGYVLIPLLTTLSLGISAYQSAYEPQQSFYLLPSRFWELAVGAMLFQAHAKGHLRPKPQIVPMLSTAGILLISVGLLFTSRAGFPFPWVLAPVIGTSLLLVGAVSPPASSDPAQAFLVAAPIRYIGFLSYSLYLWHWPVLTIMHWTIDIASAQTVCIALICIAFLSITSFHLIERPVRRNTFLRRQPSWRVVLSGFLCLGLGFTFTYQVFGHIRTFAQSVVYSDNGWQNSQIPKNTSLVASTTKPLSGRTLFVIGDSHAGAYRPLLEMASRDLGMRYQLRVAPGCRVASLKEPSVDTPYCVHFVASSIAEIADSAKPGDGVFLASLRAYRLSDQWGLLKPEEIYEAAYSANAARLRQQALAEAHQLISKLTEMGLRVLIDEPKPTFLAPPFRCMDWFNHTNPVCTPGFTISRKRLRELNRPIRESLEQIRLKHPQITVWDPFPVLCPGEVCSAFKDHHPIFSDGDHLTGNGNALLYPAFRRMALALFLRPRPLQFGE